MKKIVYGLLALVVLIGSATLFSGCKSSADTASENISKEAEAFKVQRRIVGINGITDKVEFEIEGKCSIENTGDELQVICKESKDSYTKSVVGLADNVFYISTQIKGIDVSEYRTKIIIKPQNILPDFDLQTGESG